VQGMYLRQVASPVRKTSAIAPGSFVEGWAHYTEQMMLDEGFGNNDPKLKMGQLADALLRLCRFVVGIREHIDAMTVDQATRFLWRMRIWANAVAHRSRARHVRPDLSGLHGRQAGDIKVAR